MKDRKDQEHPSYGMIMLSRVSHDGHARMYGSVLENHYGTIRLTITRSCWEHDLHEDRYHGGPELIEVEMTSAQFVEAFTTMNYAPGVPCTIRAINQRSVPEPPPVETEVQRIRSTFGAELKGFVDKMKERRKNIDKLTDKLSAKAKEQLRIELDVMIQQMESNLPFVMTQFNEASERVVSAAKQEIESFAQHRIYAAGIATLTTAPPESPQLPERTEPHNFDEERG